VVDYYAVPVFSNRLPAHLDKATIEAFRQLFTGSDSRFAIVHEAVVRAEDQWQQRPGQPSEADYFRHLGMVGEDGSVLYLSPGSTEDRYQTSWLALSMPTSTVGDSAALLNTLTGLDIPVYASASQMRRGIEIYVFLESPVPSEVAEKLAATLREVASYQELVDGPIHSYPAPSDSEQPRVRVPFSGASAGWASDFYYADDPLHPLSLDDFMSNVRRVSSKVIERLPSYGLGRDLPVEESIEAANRLFWQQELKRVRASWATEAVRQPLSLGLAGLATRLGIDEQDVVSELQALSQPYADSELQHYLDAVRTTFEKWWAGQPVAYKPFYLEAGLEPPTAKRPPYRVLKLVEKLREQLDRVGSGRTRGSDQSVYQALLRLAQRHGGEDSKGIVVSVSQRELAERSGLTTLTTRKAVKRLLAAGLLSQKSVGKKEHASKLVLIDVRGSGVTHSDQSKGSDWDRLLPLARNGPGRLGKMAVSELLHLSDLGPSTARDWAAVAGTTPTAMKDRRRKLRNAGLVSYDRASGTWSVSHEWASQLRFVLEQEGSLEAGRRDQERHVDERKKYHELHRQRSQLRQK
jgi:hypothetical protein